MREIDIHGKYIGDPIGRCTYDKHPGALDYKTAKKHHCLAKKCRFLEKYSEEAWDKHAHKQKYYNSNKGVK